jgi:hypothetical protein
VQVVELNEVDELVEVLATGVVAGGETTTGAVGGETTTGAEGVATGVETGAAGVGATATRPVVAGVATTVGAEGATVWPWTKEATDTAKLSFKSLVEASHIIIPP